MLASIERAGRLDGKNGTALGTGQGTNMARIEMLGADFGGKGAAEADTLYELGMMFATGRDCAADMVAAHKWFNIAAIKGSDRAAQVRAELSTTMSKPELARALREAREWMTAH
jgi:TPR repeat protein